MFGPDGFNVVGSSFQMFGPDGFNVVGSSFQMFGPDGFNVVGSSFQIFVQMVLMLLEVHSNVWSRWF